MDKFRSLPRIGKFIVGGGVILFTCILCSIFGFFLPEAEEPEVSQEDLVLTSMAEITLTDAASQSQNESDPMTPEPAIEPTNTESSKVAYIPGLNPADIVLSLEQRGFTCGEVEFWEGDENFPSQYYYRECQQSSSEFDIFVEIYGYDLFVVDNVVATVLDYTEPFGDLAEEFLGFLATIPYDGSEPEAAKAWVQETLPTITENGDVRTSSFGSVDFRLSGIPSGRLLDIGTFRE